MKYTAKLTDGTVIEFTSSKTLKELESITRNRRIKFSFFGDDMLINLDHIISLRALSDDHD